MGRTGDNLAKWGIADDAACPCGGQIQTMDHILRGCTLGPSAPTKIYGKQTMQPYSGLGGGVTRYDDLV